MKVAYNNCYGGFSLSKTAIDLYNEKRLALDPKSKLKYEYSFDSDKSRKDPLLIEVIEKLSEKANGVHAKLKIVDIPDEYAECYSISKYDGNEHVVCDPTKLMKHKLQESMKDLQVKDLSDEECRELLQELFDLSKQRIKHY